MNNSKIKIISMDKQKLRMVTHRDYTKNNMNMFWNHLKSYAN